jgi:hypothetical protein
VGQFAPLEAPCGTFKAGKTAYFFDPPRVRIPSAPCLFFNEVNRFCGRSKKFEPYGSNYPSDCPKIFPKFEGVSALPAWASLLTGHA